MAQLIVSMNLSLDGYIEAQGQDDGSWLCIDEAVHRAFNKLAASAKAFLYGRKVYEVMIPGWWTNTRCSSIRALWELACRSFDVAWT